MRYLTPEFQQITKEKQMKNIKRSLYLPLVLTHQKYQNKTKIQEPPLLQMAPLSILVSYVLHNPIIVGLNYNFLEEKNHIVFKPFNQGNCQSSWFFSSFRFLQSFSMLKSWLFGESLLCLLWNKMSQRNNHGWDEALPGVLVFFFPHCAADGHSHSQSSR